MQKDLFSSGVKLLGLYFLIDAIANFFQGIGIILTYSESAQHFSSPSSQMSWYVFFAPIVHSVVLFIAAIFILIRSNWLVDKFIKPSV